MHSILFGGDQLTRKHAEAVKELKKTVSPLKNNYDNNYWLVKIGMLSRYF